MTIVAKYKKYWDEKAVRDEAAREKLRHDAMNIAKRLAQILARDFSVSRVILFGSVLEKGKFNEDSDIDLAVEGLSNDAYFTALARLMMKSSFDVDLKPVEDIGDLLRQRISKGKILYEKR